MHPVNELYRIQQRDARDLDRQRLYRPGSDDRDSFIRDKEFVKSLYLNWLYGWCESWMDAEKQANEICQQESSEKMWTDYVMATWGWTVAQYNAWVQDENKKRREYWTKSDINKKIKEGLI